MVTVTVRGNDPRYLAVETCSLILANHPRMQPLRVRGMACGIIAGRTVNSNSNNSNNNNNNNSNNNNRKNNISNTSNYNGNNNNGNRNINNRNKN